MTEIDTQLLDLTQHVEQTDDWELVQQVAPIIRFDASEPFMPLALGYTVFREVAQSPSSKFMIDPAGGIAIEYAIWWDWDIEHLYELEHVWVYLDQDHRLLKVEASAHGHQIDMVQSDGTILLEDDRIHIFSESGKHGFAAERDWLINREALTVPSCTSKAGSGGILYSMFGAEAFGNPTPQEHRLAKRYMQTCAFTPTFDFSKYVDLRTIPAVTWEHLEAWIPQRIIWWREQLPQIVPHLKLVCLDSGDTMVDEGTEVKVDGEVVVDAELIPQADVMVKQLVENGYTVALVADGPRATFENILKDKFDLWDAFSAVAISGDVGVSKPDKRMFLTVLDALGITADDYGHVVMVGNHLSRDVKGANDLGLMSIWMNWSPRRAKTPLDDSENPDYTITSPSELLALLENIERNLAL